MTNKGVGTLQKYITLLRRELNRKKCYHFHSEFQCNAWVESEPSTNISLGYQENITEDMIIISLLNFYAMLGMELFLKFVNE